MELMEADREQDRRINKRSEELYQEALKQDEEK